MEMPRLLAVTLLLFALTGCSGAQAPAATVTATETATSTVTVEASVEVTVTETVTATPAHAESTPAPTPTSAAPAPSRSADADATPAVRAAAGRHVTRATTSGRGQYVIWTDLVDPRGDDGSMEAQAALDICRAVQAHLGATNVRVQEADESTFVVLGGAYPACTEV